MQSEQHLPDREATKRLGPWFGLLGGIFAWALHLVVSLSLVPVACATGTEALLYLAAGVLIAITVAALAVAWHGWRQARMSTTTDEESRKRAMFMALSGIVLSAGFLAVIIVQTLPVILQSPCEAAGSLRI